MCEGECAARTPPSTGCLICNGTVCTTSVAPDATPPVIPPQGAAPGPMERVIQVADGWERTRVHSYHTLLLPRGRKGAAARCWYRSTAGRQLLQPNANANVKFV